MAARVTRGTVGLTVRTAALSAWLSLLASAAAAQSAVSCPPPKKLAAGACVATCPAGYEDRGSECVFRSLSR